MTREVEVDVEDDRGRRVDRGEAREGERGGDARDGVRGIENQGAGGRRAGAVERDGGAVKPRGRMR